MNRVKKFLLSTFLGVVVVASFLVPASLAVFAQEDTEVVAGEPISQEDFVPTQIEMTTVEGEIVEILKETSEAYDASQEILFQQLSIRLVSGEVITVEYNRTLATGENRLTVGDKVLLNKSTSPDGESLYYIIDFVRRDALLTLFILFVGVVLLVGRKKGFSALLGLASSYLIIFQVILPGIQQGNDPIIVAIVGASMIIGITFYLSHGFNEKTTWAVVGTIISLCITGAIAVLSVNEARLTGFGAEEAAFLQVLKSGELNIRGLLLAGILIGTLGVLDDITISQASVVKELKKTNPSLSPRKLFFKAMNVGRDHIASLVNTLILVYTGSALPLLLLFSLDSSRSPIDVINYEMVAEEVIRTLVGSIGLIIAVPITTALVAWFGFQNIATKKK